MVLILTAAIIALDQFTKYLVRANFSVGETLPVIRNVFHLTYIQNRGAAFSMFQDNRVMTVAFPIIAMIACAVLLVWLVRGKEKLLSVAVALIIAGGVGNIIDRIVNGYVTDFLDFRVFPVFNVADMAVTCGCALAIIYIVFIDGHREKNGGGRDD